ncbi:MAG: hypothetical protein J6N47_07055 [Lachnospiraceae bacterium]|nr:hypothetical protein [Lachnospiraceae bacterium]
MIFMLGGCGLTEGNDSADIAEAIEEVEEQYDISLKLKNKALFPGGVICDVTVICEELPDEELRVFRFDEYSEAQCDYIYVKYGDQAYERICGVVHTVLPDAMIVVEESGYNHFYGTMYDKNTTLDYYLQNNMFRIDTVIYGEYTEDEIRALYNELADLLTDNGIDSYGFAIYVMDSADAVDDVKTYEHMPDSQAYRGVTGEHIKIYAANSQNRLSEYVAKSYDPDLIDIVFK